MRAMDANNRDAFAQSMLCKVWKIEFAAKQPKITYSNVMNF